MQHELEASARASRLLTLKKLDPGKPPDGLPK
jgi:hypothetical protein